MLKQLRKDPRFEKFDFNFIYPTTNDAVCLILKSNPAAFVYNPENTSNNSNNKNMISLYDKNEFETNNPINSSLSDVSKTDKEDYDHLSTSTAESN